MLEHPPRRKRRKKLKKNYEPISIVPNISELYERNKCLALKIYLQNFSMDFIREIVLNIAYFAELPS